MELSPNPFAILTFISAPAVLTNAACVLLFGTGNRYGRAIDRVHELAEIVLSAHSLEPAEQSLRIRQLRSAETRTQLIVRALTCFYTAVAGFVASTLVSLIGAILVSFRATFGIKLAFTLSLIAGSIGVIAILTGALMLAVETRFSFAVLREESAFLTQRIQQLHSADTTHP